MAYIGEILLFAYNWRTDDEWLPCDGRLLNIQEHQALFSIIGDQYGGDGKKTFALPDLRGRTIIGAGTRGRYTYKRAEKGGVESVALTTDNLPAHSHTISGASDPGNTNLINKDILASCGTNTLVATPQNLYGAPSGSPVPLNPAMVAGAGDGVAHDNMQPFCVLAYHIAIKGIYPQQQPQP